MRRSEAVFVGTSYSLGLAFLIWSGSWEDEYLTHRGSPPPQPFPIKGVAIHCAIALVEVLAALALLLRPRSPSNRAFVAAAPQCCWVALFALMQMHQPPFVLAHLQWSACFALAIFGYAVWSGERRSSALAV